MSENKGIAGQFVIGDGLQQGGVIEPGLVADNHDASEMIYTPVGSVVPARGFWDRLSETISAVQADRQQSDKLRAMIREEVHNALYPGGTISAHEHRRVEMSEESGVRWRGVLYRVDEEKPASVPSGVCWACGEHGKAEEMMWLDQFGKRSHLIHATHECARVAFQKPETREHRG